ncbi:GxxExxY protein [Melioribacteraceae bacterium 4301-Me]|uniref:GxxExxY protein n=1 Tax=Pyranulibacter aquaticus TaxID=3163344 RepID=UPI00359AD1FC
MDREGLNKISGLILDCSIEVHKNLGPGLLESVYEICLYKELRNRNLFVERQVPVPVIYKNEKLDVDFRVDLLVQNEVIVELKAVEILLPVHDAQLLTYMKLMNKRLGLLINFNVPKLIDGFHRKVLNF